MIPFWRRCGTGRKRELTPDRFGALFVHFRRVVNINNEILEKIADLERVLGGEYIYDRTFLQNGVSEIIDKGRHVLYHLNALSGERYCRLYDLFTTTTDQLSDILAGGPGPYGPLLVLDWDILHRDLGHLSGNKGACLGEIGNSLALPTPAGFVVSTTGYRRFMEANNLFFKIGRVMQESDDPATQAGEIAELFASAKMPSDLHGAINKAMKKVRTRLRQPELFAVRSSGVDEDGSRSFAGQFKSFINVPPDRVAETCIQVMASRFSERICHYLERDTPPEASPIAVLIQPMVKARASGILYSRNPNNPEAETMVLSAVSGFGEQLASGRDSGDRFVFERSYPFTPRESVIALPSKATATGGPDALEKSNGMLRRGSGVVGLETLRQMAEYGLLLEKRFEYPQDIEWCLDEKEQLWILQSRPLRLLQKKKEERRSLGQLSKELARLPVLMEGQGHICQLGLAGGRVVLVDEETRVEEFPIGAVAVSHFANPVLAEIVQRAAALVTDIGSPTSHLATIAREYRTPALFGTGKATSLLQEGMQVMVDIEAKTIYQGHVDLPPGLPESDGFAPPPGDKEASLLRRLLRLIAPLNLVDPSAPSFKMENCQTIHDFLRFSHEKAVAELIHFHTSGKLVSGGRAPLLATKVPIKIRVLDIGGGLSRSGEKEVGVQDVTCSPLLALLQGLQNKEFWLQEPVPFGIKDVLSGMSDPLTMLTHNPDYTGENLAIIADHYCDLSLRMGYHFNIIDCYLSEQPDDNYVYFRFVGGFAEPGKRQRRAVMISQILSGLHFKVEIKGDLVLGKVKMLEQSDMERILVHLGELVAFTRQLDVKMGDDQAIERFFNDFLKRIRKSLPSARE